MNSTESRRRPGARIGATRHRWAVRSKPAGFTLLEVILALVILGAALAMLGEVVQLANRHAVEAHAETQAQSLAESVMDQILTGVIERESAEREAIEVDDSTPWVYSITVGTSAITGIVPVEVVIEQDLEARFNPVKFRLVRWVPTVLERPESPLAGAGAAGPGGQSPPVGSAPSGGATGAGGAGGTPL